MDKKKELFVIGQISLHWGRLEFGNIGNYYIVEPLFRELHRVFPEYEIKTTFQMTERFCQSESVKVLPMALYYGFRDNELELAKKELAIAERIAKNKDQNHTESSDFINEVINSEFVVDISGDMWSDNAEMAGKDRFEVGLIKDRIAQLFKPTVLLASSPGPFEIVKETLSFAKEVYSQFKVVINRESESRKVLEQYGFDVRNTIDSVCPSFLYTPIVPSDNMGELIRKYISKKKINIGFIICGFNFSIPPFSKWPRDDYEYSVFINVIKHIRKSFDANIILMSHANGFPIPPNEFRLLHAKDYMIAERIKELLCEQGLVDDIQLVSEVLQPWETKAFIKSFDVLVSGRIHGAVAGLSQAVPTVIVDYGMEPKAHKHLGLAKIVGCEKYIVDPADEGAFISIIDNVIESHCEIRNYLQRIMPSVQNDAHKQFDYLAKIVGE